MPLDTCCHCQVVIREAPQDVCCLTMLVTYACLSPLMQLPIWENHAGGLYPVTNMREPYRWFISSYQNGRNMQVIYIQLPTWENHAGELYPVTNMREPSRWFTSSYQNGRNMQVVYIYLVTKMGETCRLPIK